MRGKAKLRIPPRPAKDWAEILAITLHQRRYNTLGERLKSLSMEQVALLTPEDREQWKALGWLKLPDLVTPHGPLRYPKDRVELCLCDGCQRAREAWRKKTGIV